MAEHSADLWKPPVINLTGEELDEMRALVRDGKLPRDAIAQYKEAVARNVFGHDAKKDKHGDYIEKGLGTAGNETTGHFSALMNAELRGTEPRGTYQAALAEIWRRDPAHAKKLRLPKPQSQPQGGAA